MATGWRHSCSSQQVCTDPPCPGSGHALLTVPRAEDDKAFAHPKTSRADDGASGSRAAGESPAVSGEGTGRAEDRAEEETPTSFLKVRV